MKPTAGSLTKSVKLIDLYSFCPKKRGKKSRSTKSRKEKGNIITDYRNI
jgi:hypothetical protein